MRFAPDCLHHVLRHVLGGKRSEAAAHHLHLQAGAEMIEQDGEGLAVAARAHRGEKTLMVAHSRRPVFLPVRAIIPLQPGNLVHGTFSPW